MSTVCIIDGFRKTTGATIIPDTAPRLAAKPQPAAYIHPTRTPISRLATGAIAAARMARPIFVKRKNSQSTITVTSVTAMTPTSWCEIATPPIVNGFGLKAPRNAFCSAPRSTARAR